MSFVFCRLYPSPPSHHGNVWVLSLYCTLNNTVSPVRSCLSIGLERFRESLKEDERGPLSIKSSLDSPEISVNCEIDQVNEKKLLEGFPVFVLILQYNEILDYQCRDVVYNFCEYCLNAIVIMHSIVEARKS
jgi:hypothetical protein